jgi:N-acetylmuramoyl-L-alanine amidase CwlA
MTTYAAPSPLLIPARWHGGSQTPRSIVMHSTVSPCKPGAARATAEFFAREDNPTSAHYCVDPLEVVQCVPDHTVAYHCGYNQDSIGIEMCEYPAFVVNRVNLARWLTPEHRRMKRRAAHLVARLCLAYDIPPYFVGVKGLLAGKHGVTTHACMSKAFKRSTHWDPGAWPRRQFMRQVRRQIALIKSGA